METAPTPAIKPRKGQVRPAVKQALTLMVERGLSIPKAAKEAGLQYESLRIALKRPHVREALSDVRRAWRESQTLLAWKTVADLQQNAASEDVRLKSARTFIGAAGELEPDSGRGAALAGVYVQIITAPEARPVQVNNRGVVESPPWRPCRDDLAQPSDDY